ncbi:predicted protein [Sclerotinia sclerotiorum 1980 UF-70]|uniref:Uncharacterized protein n=1 Tax=Sclerotinia sclerotiorum (strain ATCC 18683 / 1980 / Ss-1) TaxID=665079 RepID=A7EFQ2_SCLS1|nr:predicted protein [Sclerotinia sclerotiorum 1980 UF-70]EDO01668.1 predicted protein [Sclerotinia sclerotiorum 1980 UF-70]
MYVYEFYGGATGKQQEHSGTLLYWIRYQAPKIRHRGLGLEKVNKAFSGQSNDDEESCFTPFRGEEWIRSDLHLQKPSRWVHALLP